MPCDYRLYPPDWKAIRARILERAEHRCERCNAPNGRWIVRVPGSAEWSGVNQDAEAVARLRAVFGRTMVKVVLTCAHLDHDLGHNTDDNLAALCQRCHLRHDTHQHVVSRAETRRRREADRGQLTLSEAAGTAGGGRA